MAAADDNDPRLAFGTMLRKARRRAGLSQTQVAKIIGSTQAYVSRTENGLENPPLMTLLAFVAAVDQTFTFGTLAWIPGDPPHVRLTLISEVGGTLSEDLPLEDAEEFSDLLITMAGPPLRRIT